MLVSFDQMPDTSRLWIYQAGRKLSSDEEALVRKAASQFIKDWTAHGSDLKASFELMYDQFLIITLDETVSQASGCSIDSSVSFLRSVEDTIGVSFLNNDKVAFLIEDNVQLLPANRLKEKVSKKVVVPNTRVFDNTVQNLGLFKTKWLVESSKTWVNRFFN